MFRTKNKRVAAFGMLVFAALSAAAFAYWTAGGSGSGTGSSAGAQTALTVNQTTTLSPMYPGDTAQTLTGTFNNPNSGPIYVGTVTASIASVSKSGLPAVGCDATDFTLANAAMTVNAQVPAGNAKGSWTGATIQFNNKAGTNQDACKGVTVNLSYAIS